jgi:hypothetical protein
VRHAADRRRTSRAIRTATPAVSPLIRIEHASDATATCGIWWKGADEHPRQRAHDQDEKTPPRSGNRSGERFSRTTPTRHRRHRHVHHYAGPARSASVIINNPHAMHSVRLALARHRLLSQQATDLQRMPQGGRRSIAGGWHARGREGDAPPRQAALPRRCQVHRLRTNLLP